MLEKKQLYLKWLCVVHVQWFAPALMIRLGFSCSWYASVQIPPLSGASTEREDGIWGMIYDLKYDRCELQSDHIRTSLNWYWSRMCIRSPIIFACLPPWSCPPNLQNKSGPNILPSPCCVPRYDLFLKLSQYARYMGDQHVCMRTGQDFTFNLLASRHPFHLQKDNLSLVTSLLKSRFCWSHRNHSGPKAMSIS